MIGDTLEYIRGLSVAPVTHHLSDISEDAIKLSLTEEELFHNFVAQLLYLPKQAHSGINMEVSLLFTRVVDPDNDYYKMTASVTKYIQGIVNLPLTMSIDKSGNIKWYVDA